MNNRLETATPAPPGSRPKRHPKGLPRRSGAKAGWTPERRARHAALIRRWQPWRHATGPKTDAGKARVAMNALRHGHRSRAWIDTARRIRRAIKLCADTLLLVRVRRLEQERRAHPESLQRARALLSAAAPHRAHHHLLRRLEPRATPPT